MPGLVINPSLLKTNYKMHSSYIRSTRSGIFVMWRFRVEFIKMVNVLETKIRPPRSTAKILTRPRVNDVLMKGLNFRLTILQAGAGYGKSTALTKLSGEYSEVIWYQITEEDRDPLVFLLHLCHATRYAFPELEGLPFSLLKAWDGSSGLLPTREIIYQFLNAISSGLPENVFLILDDVHLVSEIPEIAHILDRIIGLVPPNLHIILSSRPILKLPNLSRWRSLGQVQIIDQSVLAFTIEEITALFKQYYDYDLSDGEVEDLYFATEGWAITLQLIWQSLNSGTIGSISEALARAPTSMESLFDVLAADVFEGQDKEIQDFMRATSVLRVMTPEICDYLLDSVKSDSRLDYLRKQDLFVVDLEETGLRYHPVFRQFLNQQLSIKEKSSLHQRAAEFYEGGADYDLAIYHLILAQDTDRVALLLDSYGEQLKDSGRLDTLAGYLDKIPPEALHKYPTLLLYLGDLARFHSRFQEALGWYQQAEALWIERGKMDGASRALRGQARVYLDTVNPSKAGELLQEAIRLSDGIRDRESHARLYELLAENKLNSGHVDEAEHLRKQAEILRHEGPSDSQLLYRVLLRTGKIEEAQQKLELKAIEESVSPIHTPRAHRETQLLLSLIYAIKGDVEGALLTAIEGTKRGQELASPYVTAVGFMRQGHALMLKTDRINYEEVRTNFEKAVEISRELATPRLRVEAFWGLCRVAGFQGYLDEACRYADRGIAIASRAGDEWIASLIRLAVGASFSIIRDFRSASEWLNKAIRGFEECSDPFGLTAARLWLSLGLYLQGETELFAKIFIQVLETSQKRGYDFLFVRPSLNGFPDIRPLVPLLIHARENGWVGRYPEKLLRLLDLADIKLHPGYQLRIKAFGNFQVCRGNEQIQHNDWRREKARQLFQVLLTNREAPLDRDQIFELLWPEATPEAAQRNFKVTLNTLYSVLEPDRKPGAPSAFVSREGSVYAVRPEADIWFDVNEFLEKVRDAELIWERDSETAYSLLGEAINLYEGEYLPDNRYEAWAAVEREHLSVVFLQAADRFCEAALERETYDVVIEISRRILEQDNCWERAYRYLMMAFDRLGDRGQMARTYQRCVETLRKEIDVAPAVETVSLYDQLTINR